MSDINIAFDKDSPSTVNEEINIKIISEGEGNLEYKFLEGTPNERSFTWKQIQDYSDNKECKWKPQKPGNYMIMIQTIDKDLGVTNSLRTKYKVNGINEKEIIEEKNNNKLIQEVIIDKTSLILGEKLNLDILSPGDEEVLLYRFWIKGIQGWEPLRDYYKNWRWRNINRM